MTAGDIAGQCAVPPHDLTAERAVLGAILIDNTALDQVHLRPEDFYDRRNSLIFRTMQGMAAQGKALDCVTVYAVLKAESGQPLGGYLSELAESTPSAANVADYAEIVRDKADARSLMTLTADIYQRVQAGEPVGSLCERLRQRTTNLADRGRGGFKSMAWAELKHLPQKQTDWVVDGLLRRGGFSLLYAAPKVGKSSTARTLARAVALGLPWLGRDVRQGGVVYLALEEMPADVQAHFAQMGLPDAARIEFVFERASEHALRKLEQLITRLEPTLIVVDTLIQLVSTKGFDINDYALTARALQPLLALARRSNVHVLCLHHARKSGGSYGEEGLGSQALSGAVDVIFSLKRGEGYRSISSIQRRGRPLKESVLRLDEETGLVELAGMKKDVDAAIKGEEILAFLEGLPEPVTMVTIQAALKCQRKPLNDALRALVERGKIRREGSGKRGDAYHYFAVPEGPETAAVLAEWPGTETVQ